MAEILDDQDHSPRGYQTVDGDRSFSGCGLTIGCIVF